MKQKLANAWATVTKNGWTTLIGICEGTVMSVAAETLFGLTNKQRAAIIGLAALRATFGAMTRDAKKVEAPSVGQS